MHFFLITAEYQKQRVFSLLLVALVAKNLIACQLRRLRIEGSTPM